MRDYFLGNARRLAAASNYRIRYVSRNILPHKHKSIKFRQDKQVAAGMGSHL